MVVVFVSTEKFLVVYTFGVTSSCEPEGQSDRHSSGIFPRDQTGTNSLVVKECEF